MLEKEYKTSSIYAQLFVFGNQPETNQQLRVCVRLLSAPLKFLLRGAYH